MILLDGKAFHHLLAVVRAGSIRGAAGELGVAPSAVSRHIADLEHRLGIPLLERTPRGVELTDAGRLAVEHARRFFEDQQLLTEQLDQLKGLSRGVVRLCCGEGFVADLIDNGLKCFSQDYPDIRVRIDLAGTRGLMEAISQGDSDIGIAYNPIIDENIQSLAITRQPLSAVVPPDHPLAGQRGVRLRELLESPLALLSEGHGIRHLVGRAAADCGKALTPVLETTSMDVLRRFVRAGKGITFLPRFVVATELAEGSLGLVELADPLMAEATTHLIVRAQRRLPESVARMADCLIREMDAFRDRPGD